MAKNKQSAVRSWLVIIIIVLAFLSMYRINPGAPKTTELTQLEFFKKIDEVKIVDPVTLEPLPPGEKGELVFTSLTKEAFPEVERPAAAALTQGELSQAEIFKKIKAKFNSASIQGIAEDAKTEDGQSVLENTLAKASSDSPAEITLDVKDYFAATEFVKNDPALKMDYLIDVTAIDYPDHFELITQLRSIDLGHKVFFCVPLKKDESIPEERRATSLLAKVPSITGLYPAASVKEREVYDMFGINFVGHDDLRRIFLDKDFVGYPLRKDFTHPDMIKRPV